MGKISFMGHAVKGIACSLHPGADVCNTYVQETHPCFFMRKSFVRSLERSRERGADVNIIFGPLTYSLVRESPFFRQEYEKLAQEGVLLAFNPCLEEETAEYRGARVPLRYLGNRFISSFPGAGKEEKKNMPSRAVLGLYGKSVPIKEFSASMEELVRRFEEL